MTDTSSLFPWLLLQQLPGMKPALLRRLFAADPDCDDPLRWLEWSPTRLRALGASAELLAAISEWRKQGSTHSVMQKIQRDCVWLAERSVQLLPLNDPRYPSLLLEIADPPPLLYVWGEIDFLLAPQIAVVGSRRPSPQGLRDAQDFGAALARAGFVITSGLALGIDAAAHRAALDVGGRTVAVLGCGIDTRYPAANSDLTEAISRQGAVISEFPLGTPPRANQFPSRNRIISGLSLGVFVIEAAMQSGSLVTARLAAEQNREVFALPGSIHSPVSRGCNSLIRQGATLVQSADDIFEELRGWLSDEAPGVTPLPGAEPSAPAPELGEDEAQVFAAIGSQPISLDEILVSVTQPLPALLAILAELELMGLIESRGGIYLRAAEACAS
ncbi:MAG TPA: DNA-processing protein DprA [Spongiibacteraceae bacterium]|nr:DNA-processing protein DprA [Spongiibacteraceae bacterium]